jgi:hypothetical protein
MSSFSGCASLMAASVWKAPPGGWQSWSPVWLLGRKTPKTDSAAHLQRLVDIMSVIHRTSTCTCEQL